MTLSIAQRNLYQQFILEHAKKPRHRGKTNPIHRYQRGYNPSCGDTVELTVKLSEAGDIIEELKFEGKGCAISIASADLMAEKLQGKSVEQALSMVQQFRDMMKGQSQFPKDLRKLNALQGVSQFPVRIKCASLCWHTLKVALESSKITESSSCVCVNDADRVDCKGDLFSGGDNQTDESASD